MSQNELWYTAQPIYVPKINDEEITKMRHIEPLLRVPNTCWYQRIKEQNMIDPRAVSFLWDAEPTGVQMAFSPLDQVSIISFHKYGAPSLFKPSLAEVYAAIRRFLISWNDIRFFLLDSNLDSQSIIGDCHWCVCHLFGEKYYEATD